MSEPATQHSTTKQMDEHDLDEVCKPKPAVRDLPASGSARNLRPDVVEVKRPASRGRLRWQIVSDVAITWEQLELW